MRSTGKIYALSNANLIEQFDKTLGDDTFLRK
jgi:hypothetical protein